MTTYHVLLNKSKVVALITSSLPLLDTFGIGDYEHVIWTPEQVIEYVHQWNVDNLDDYIGEDTARRWTTRDLVQLEVKGYIQYGHLHKSIVGLSKSRPDPTSKLSSDSDLS